MTTPKELARNIIRGLGYDVTRRDPSRMGLDPFRDMQFLLEDVADPIVLDVGANVGQSVKRFREAFPAAEIHSFEPSPTTFKVLQQEVGGLPGVKVWNNGVGSAEATMEFFENSLSVMSSFLSPSELAWGTVNETSKVDVLTLDAFADHQGIEFVHVLKSDTQGFELEVFKGADSLLSNGNIGLVYFEFIFSRMYEGLPSFDEVFRFLVERDYRLVAIYDQHFQQDLLSWADMLFISRRFDARRIRKDPA